MEVCNIALPRLRLRGQKVNWAWIENMYRFKYYDRRPVISQSNESVQKVCVIDRRPKLESNTAVDLCPLLMINCL